MSPLIQNTDTDTDTNTDSSSDADSEVLEVEGGEGLGASFVFIRGESLEQEEDGLEQELGESFESKI